MIWIPYREPTLDEMLSDSIIQAVMEADRVDPHTVRAALRQIRSAERVPPPAHRGYERSFAQPVAMSQRPHPWDSGTAA